ncbi:hypothetical protein PRK78_005088 [Emydomyces testavorans]|uniref:Uncharacterized protein n=1 Tax=Emydomyces testavorans TaxID=2070801 RepID=A0AAF0DJ11_9EURO|nr:hypothetical protein PRK78_005088 [Emydomyces testavorans]
MIESSSISGSFSQLGANRHTDTPEFYKQNISEFSDAPAGPETQMRAEWDTRGVEHHNTCWAEASSSSNSPKGPMTLRPMRWWPDPFWLDILGEELPDVVVTQGRFLRTPPPSPPPLIDNDKFQQELDQALDLFDLRQGWRKRKYGEQIAEEYPSGWTPSDIRASYWESGEEALEKWYTMSSSSSSNPTPQAMNIDEKPDVRPQLMPRGESSSNADSQKRLMSKLPCSGNSLDAVIRNEGMRLNPTEDRILENLVVKANCHYQPY